MTDQTTAGAGVRHVSEVEFEAAVVSASHDRPVIVDFWAPWCGPCHQLSPLLERVAARFADDVDTVKVNVDEAPGVALRYGIRGIPAVKAFSNGAVVAEFVGVQPEPSIERLFVAVAPSPADRLVTSARTATADGEAERLYREALATDPAHPEALVGLGGILVERGEEAEARELLAKAPSDPEARRLLARLTLAANGEDDLDELRASAGQGDPAAWLRLGRALAARGDYDEALPALIEAVRHPAARDEGRTATLDVFSVLGDDHDLVRTWRPKLAAALF